MPNYTTIVICRVLPSFVTPLSHPAITQPISTFAGLGVTRLGEGDFAYLFSFFKRLLVGADIFLDSFYRMSVNAISAISHATCM